MAARNNIYSWQSPNRTSPSTMQITNMSENRALEDKEIRYMNKLLWGKIGEILPWDKCEHQPTAAHCRGTCVYPFYTPVYLVLSCPPSCFMSPEKEITSDLHVCFPSQFLIPFQLISLRTAWENNLSWIWRVTNLESVLTLWN